MSAEQQDRGQHEGPLDPRDYSRRTLLANERTYLAWWRTVPDRQGAGARDVLGDLGEGRPMRRR